MRITWGAYYVLLYLYRCTYSVLGQTLILRLTTIPDTRTFQTTSFAKLSGYVSENPLVTDSWSMTHNAGVLMRLIAAAMHTVFFSNPILINIGFQSIAFAGLVYLLRGIEPRARGTLAILVMFPSFTLWSSIASKEAIVVFLVCVISRYVVDIYYGRDRFRLHHILAIGILYIFKPHFMPAVSFVLVVSWTARYLRQPATAAVLIGSTSLFILYLVRDILDVFSRKVSLWIFAEPGVSSRSVAFLSEPFDIFRKAPEGMLRSFMGPTLSEASAGGALHLFSYLESIAILMVLAVILMWRLPRLPVYSFIIGGFTLFWTMFSTYPLGVANSGTAVRYRTDYFVLILLSVVILMSRDIYVTWRLGRSPHPKSPHPLSVAVGPNRDVESKMLQTSNS